MHPDSPHLDLDNDRSDDERAADAAAHLSDSFHDDLHDVPRDSGGGTPATGGAGVVQDRDATGPREPVRGDVLIVRVDRVAAGGSCVARHEGRVLFVRHTLPGELVRVRVTEARRGYLRADAVQVLEASPDRVPAPCPYARPGQCGGCDWQHAAPATQRVLKGAAAAEQFARLGGLELRPRVEELPGGGLGWRTRIRFAVTPAGRPGLHPYRSHRVLPVADCLLAAPAVRALGVLGRQWPGATAVEAVAAGGGAAAAVVQERSGRARVHGPRALEYRALGRTFRVTVPGFWQVHPAAAEVLAAAVLDGLDPAPGERGWDLYGGVGLFAAALAGRGVQVELVESSSRAAADARHNLADLPVQVHTGRVDVVMTDLAPADLTVLDPPRAGAGVRVVAAVAAATRRRVAYVSCDPGTLARDLAAFAGHGWQVSSLRLFDAFPNTQHLECVAILERPGGQS